MSTHISAYYSSELGDWNEAIQFYEEEIEGLTRQLAEVVSRNSIIGIAARVETEQDILNRITDGFFRFQAEIGEQSAKLHSDSTYVDDEVVTADIQEKQESLRDRMQQLEKEYVDAKFNCYRFLSDTLKKK